MKQHHYTTKIKWTGNTGKGTLDYQSYLRNHEILINGKYASIKGSSDPSFRGNPSHYNPEDLFLSSLSACHMLWFLHLASQHKIVVVNYLDNAKGTMKEHPDGSGQFTAVTLYPEVTIKNKDQIELAQSLHHQANKMCFIANSCNFKIQHQPVCKALI